MWKRWFLWRDPVKVMNYHMLHYLTPNTSKGIKNVRPGEENKGLDKISTGFHQHNPGHRMPGIKITRKKSLKIIQISPMRVQHQTSS